MAALPRPSWNALNDSAALVCNGRAVRDCRLLCLLGMAAAGRAYAAYGGIYILSSLWLWLVEKTRPDHWDMIGACICLIGAAVILYGSRNN